MVSSIIASIAADASPQEQVDWLELTAFFDTFKRARLDEIAGGLHLQADGDDEDIAAEDAERDRLREDIEAEVQERSQVLGAAYPFELSEDGECLTLKIVRERPATSLYFLCLILSHVTRSPILKEPPKDADLRDVRKRHFQTFSTLAVAGMIKGPALSLGWPRANRETILNVIVRACSMSQTGTPRQIPATTANPSAKDGGIDVLAWEHSNDASLPSVFWFAQAASGHGWRDKSAKDELPSFLRDYFDIAPQCNHGAVTVCPFVVSRRDLERVSFRHGTVLHRKSGPLAALMGLQLARSGVHVEESNAVGGISMWLGKYRRGVKTEHSVLS